VYRRIKFMEENIVTLENEIKAFANSLPYWAKYLAQIILSGNSISDTEINNAYLYLLEYANLKEKTNKPEIAISYHDADSGIFRQNLLLSKLQNIEGVNALVENQFIEFNPNLTIIYGTNGSGKSGYVRLFKKVFYSKAPEEILPNIHLDQNPKPIKADFTFISNDEKIDLTFSDKESAEFSQFSVFDGKGLLQQLSDKNEFVFRPAGLRFFERFNDAVKKVEHELNSDIQSKNTTNEFALWFEGESEIKTFVENLSANTKNEEFLRYTPFSLADKENKEKIQTTYDEFLISVKGKEKEISKLNNIKRLLGDNKNSIEKLNHFFSTEYLGKIHKAISDYLLKSQIAKAEGIEKFKSERIVGIGTKEWRNFITAAEVFARNQKSSGHIYPEEGDICLLCHQPLKKDAEVLITNYWEFIKSVAEENLKKAQDALTTEKTLYEKLNFELFIDDNALTSWLYENYPKEIEVLRQKLKELKGFSESIILDINNKTLNNHTEIKISTDTHKTIDEAIDKKIKLFQEDEQSKELEKLLKQKTFYLHKEKYNSYLVKFAKYIKDMQWVRTANQINFPKRKITDLEKSLSDKYFNQRYVDVFNEECLKLNGNFGIQVNHTGSAGKSYKQLKLKGKDPHSILSEGEQKVIAIADFISEMNLSEINRGVIFDDPVTSLDDFRKSQIAKRLVEESEHKQTIVFTHDLVFVYSLLSNITEKSKCSCHWIECQDGKPGYVWPNNTPSYEDMYKNAEPARKLYNEAKKEDCPPNKREFLVKAGFTALRTCYEVLVIKDLFKNVVKRFDDRVSIESLHSVKFDKDLVDELQDCFALCCRYMEGHTHSDKYAYKKPMPQNLFEEIERYEAIKKIIKNS
jgi:ABC-type transport system involved in cytochrome c biogenesis ATPase subunit